MCPLPPVQPFIPCVCTFVLLATSVLNKTQGTLMLAMSPICTQGRNALSLSSLPFHTRTGVNCTVFWPTRAPVAASYHCTCMGRAPSFACARNNVCGKSVCWCMRNVCVGSVSVACLRPLPHLSSSRNQPY